MHAMSASPSRTDSEDGHESEDTPLLPDPTPTKLNRHQRHRATHLKLYAIIFLVNIAFQILVPAQLRIYERIFCNQWYHEHNSDQIPSDGLIPEHLCKIAPVQRQVSSLRGLLQLFEATPGLVMAIPIGILADIFGRRLFFRIELCVMMLQQFWITIVTFFPNHIPIRAIWLEAALNFFSGGMMVAEMLFACVVTDITPREQLSTVFFYFNAIGQTTRVLGPAIAGGLMHLNAWFAVLAGLTALSATWAILLTVPETLQKRSDYIRLDSDEAEDHKRPTQLQQFRHTVIDAFKELGIVWTDWRLLFLALLYPFRMLGNAVGELLQLYVSNRYGWSLADAAFLFSIQGVAATIILFLVLPWSSDMIGRKFNLSVIQKNVVLTRISIFVLAIAYLIEGAAPTIAFLIGGLLFETLGAGLTSTLRALAGVLVDSKDSGRVFSVLAISEVLSTMIAFPATTSLFNVGLEKGGGIWLGLPYFVTAGTTAAAFVLMSMLRFERR